MKKVLYIVEDVDAAQFRYRVKNISEALEESSKWELKWVLTSEFQDEDLDGIDLVVVLRQSSKNGKILKIIKKIKARELKVLFDLDDLIFSYRDLPTLMFSTNSKNVLYWVGYVWGIRRIAKRVDGFIATNSFLAKKLKMALNKPVVVVPNSLNKEQVAASSKLVKNKKDGKGFLIGYFSGSPTHKRDFSLVEPELIRFLNEHDDANLEVVGCMEFSNEMKKMIKDGRVRIMKIVNYLKLEELISKVDVNIVPLVLNDFTNCKSELKFFEAGVVETVTVASPAYVFKMAISDGVNGFLANEKEWYNKLNNLYNNFEEREKVAKTARKYVLNEYYGEKFLSKVEEAYESFE